MSGHSNIASPRGKRILPSVALASTALAFSARPNGRSQTRSQRRHARTSLVGECTTKSGGIFEWLPMLKS
jgi:hypothetical protein